MHSQIRSKVTLKSGPLNGDWSLPQACLTCLLAFALLASGKTCLAQDVNLPATGTVAKNTPMFWLINDGRTPIVLLPAGASIDVEAREGPWYKVVYHDPSNGDQTGYVSPFDVRIDLDASSERSLTRDRKFSQRGFIESRGFGFPQTAANDLTRGVGDALFRDEVFVRPKPWLQFASGLDFRANSHGEVEDVWRLDFADRSLLRPRAAVHRLTASVATRHLAFDLGKQFIRWGRADILSPTDRFAPRDYLNVIDTEFLAVLGARASVHAGGETFEAVWVPRMTPSRLPLINQRWTVIPPEATDFALKDEGSVFPKQAEQGARWSHAGRFEMGLSFFNGFNHLPQINPDIDAAHSIIRLTRTYPDLRTYGLEFAVPTPTFVLKGESAYFTSPSSTAEQYVLYVVELERQIGEWLLDGGYAGEVVTESHEGFPFAAERGVARSIIGRASYTVDPRRTVAIEAAVRQNGQGLYSKADYSQTFGQHWRLTVAGVVLAGDSADFLGQYQRNSHMSAAVRLSF
jgi:hypothetical protein